MTFVLLFVHNTFSLVWVAEWPPLGKELSTRLAVCSHCLLSVFNSRFFPFGLEGGVWFLIASVPCYFYWGNHSF